MSCNDVCRSGDGSVADALINIALRYVIVARLITRSDSSQDVPGGTAHHHQRMNATWQRLVFTHPGLTQLEIQELLALLYILEDRV